MSGRIDLLGAVNHLGNCEHAREDDTRFDARSIVQLFLTYAATFSIV
jgi:hypothetical protein